MLWITSKHACLVATLLAVSVVCGCGGSSTTTLPAPDQEAAAEAESIMSAQEEQRKSRGAPPKSNF